MEGRNWCSSDRWTNRRRGASDHSDLMKKHFHCQGVLRRQPRGTSGAAFPFVQVRSRAGATCQYAIFCRHHPRSTSLSLIPSRRPRALPPLFVCQLLIWRLKLAPTTGFPEWDKTPACPFRRGLGLQLVTGGPPTRIPSCESCRIAPLTTVVCGLV